MKTKNCLLIVLAFISLNLFAQETKKKKVFDVIVKDNQIKSNQFVLDFLKSNSRLKSRQLTNLINNQRRTNSSSFYTANTRTQKKFGKRSPSVTKIFMDNEVILDEGINRLYLLDQIRMKEIAKITRSNVSYDKEIHIYRL